MFYKNRFHYNDYYFICDTVDDIKNLPTATNKIKDYPTPAPGSVAFVIDGTLVYMYGNDDEWHEL